MKVHQINAGPSTASSSSSLIAARRWKMFGRLSRGPKLPNKRAESSSESDSDDGSEDSSSLGDAEDLCVEIKTKEKDREAIQ